MPAKILSSGELIFLSLGDQIETGSHTHLPVQYLLVLVPSVLSVVQYSPLAHSRNVDPKAWILGHLLALQLLLVPDVGLNQMTGGFLGPHAGKTTHTCTHTHFRTMLTHVAPSFSPRSLRSL